MKELHSLGFQDVSQCEEALHQSGGEVKGALSLLQRPLMEPFHQHIWMDQPEPPIDPKHVDKQVWSCRSTVLTRAQRKLVFLLVSEDVQATAGVVQPAQLGAL